ncbi:MAG: aldo/keto reductase [Clostridia bacterium]|nr:aldo/keto reductase [Clostridia bacterium]
MIYKHFCGEKLSALGLGAMRLPTGADGKIDRVATAEMVAYAMANGVNYFDTAWGYHEGESEIVMGDILSAYPRDSLYLATKFPGYDLSNMGKVEEIFEKQLQKCGVTYFDFYLFHNVCEKNIEEYLNPQNRIYEYLLEQKKNGRIKHLGFSTHATNPTMQRFLDAYGKDMEFCQIQLNYLDYHFQAAKEKMEILREWGIPVWVMEPVRGGKLANLAPQYVEQLRVLRPEEKPVAFAFRFLQSLEGIGVTLSGMSNMEQLQDNVATFNEEKPLNGVEMTQILQIADDMVRQIVLPCTGCRYCEEKCPKGLPISYLLSLYNEHSFSDGGFLAPMALSALPREQHPDACIACRQCEKVCPQEIKISGAMSYFAAKLKH